MSIEVHFWFSTTHIFGTRVKNAVGSLFSTPLNENAGHVNFKMDIIEGTPAFCKMQENKGQWIYEKSLGYVGEVKKDKSAIVRPDGETSLTGINTKKQRTLKLDYRQANKVKVNVIHHSFWPGPKPPISSIVKDLLHLVGLTEPSKGVVAELSRHELDMDREETSKKATTIEHQAPITYIDPVIEEQKYIKELLKKALILQLHELRAKHQKEVDTIQLTRATLLKQLTVEKEPKAKVLALKLSLLKKAYQTNPDTNIQKEILKYEAFNHEKKTPIELELKKLDAELIRVNTNFNKQIKECESEIQELQSTIKAYTTHLQKSDKEIVD
ncbi:hypothetical protein ACNVED_14440 [Legionella sp. D16C41]|uniref:hypothetical protein n=1 Tax=Legionella sp. D16C41 TaxID=3402688 RepID=UPI003AF508B7